MMGVVMDAVTQRTLLATRENLTATLSGVRWGAASSTPHAVRGAAKCPFVAHE